MTVSSLRAITVPTAAISRWPRILTAAFLLAALGILIAMSLSASADEWSFARAHADHRSPASFGPIDPHC